MVKELIMDNMYNNNILQDNLKGTGKFAYNSDKFQNIFINKKNNQYIDNSLSKSNLAKPQNNNTYTTNKFSSIPRSSQNIKNKFTSGANIQSTSQTPNYIQKSTSQSVQNDGYSFSVREALQDKADTAESSVKEVSSSNDTITNTKNQLDENTDSNETSTTVIAAADNKVNETDTEENKKPLNLEDSNETENTKPESTDDLPITNEAQNEAADKNSIQLKVDTEETDTVKSEELQNLQITNASFIAAQSGLKPDTNQEQNKINTQFEKLSDTNTVVNNMSTTHKQEESSTVIKPGEEDIQAGDTENIKTNTVDITTTTTEETDKSDGNNNQMLLDENWQILDETEQYEYTGNIPEENNIETEIKTGDNNQTTNTQELPDGDINIKDTDLPNDNTSETKTNTAKAIIDTDTETTFSDTKTQINNSKENTSVQTDKQVKETVSQERVSDKPASGIHTQTDKTTQEAMVKENIQTQPEKQTSVETDTEIPQIKFQETALEQPEPAKEETISLQTTYTKEEVNTDINVSPKNSKEIKNTISASQITENASLEMATETTTADDLSTNNTDTSNIKVQKETVTEVEKKVNYENADNNTTLLETNKITAETENVEDKQIKKNTTEVKTVEIDLKNVTTDENSEFTPESENSVTKNTKLTINDSEDTTEKITPDTNNTNNSTDKNSQNHFSNQSSKQESEFDIQERTKLAFVDMTDKTEAEETDIIAELESKFDTSEESNIWNTSEEENVSSSDNYINYSDIDTESAADTKRIASSLDEVVDETVADDLNISIKGSVSSSDDIYTGTNSTTEQLIRFSIEGESGFTGKLNSIIRQNAEQTSAANSSSKEILAQINEKLTTFNFRPGAKLTMQLSPENLGTLELKLTNTTDGIIAEMTASSDDAGDILNKHIDELKDTLQKYGVRFDRVNVSTNQTQYPGAQQDYTEQGNSQKHQQEQKQQPKEERGAKRFEDMVSSLYEENDKE